MLKISRLADYATVVMTHLARTSERVHNARTISLSTHITLPTVQKLLKQLSSNELLASKQGTKGGYQLARPADQISLVDIINAVDGGVKLTECSEGVGICDLESMCSIRSNWRLISHAVESALSDISLEQLARPFPHIELGKPTISYQENKNTEDSGSN